MTATDTRRSGSAEPVAVRSAFTELSTWNAKELYRDRKGSFSILFMFFFFFLLIIGLNFVVNYGNRPEPVVAVSGEQSAVDDVMSSLERAGIPASTSSDAAGDTDAVVVVDADRAVIMLSSEDPPRWIALASAVADTGYSSGDVVVVDDTGAPQLDLLRSNLAGVAAIGFMAITFMGTAVPVVSLRQRGTLRLLGTTPVRKLTFIAAQTPVRFGLGAVVGAVVVAVAASLGYLDVAGTLRLIVTFVLGLLMFFSFAYLLASRSRNAEIINQISVLVPVLALFASGNVFPKDFLPDGVLVALDVLPTTWFMQAAGRDLTGTEGFASVYVLWAMMLGATVVVSALAAKLFLWDDRER
ncbi:ABC transporter permease [Frigoribacterium sp. 2-23]|uniref:ABC transporter permease n=1 Tax=Frigoribacterium sp. 2-23 TaxID=3415006 RepID=UPI003C706001